MRASKRTMKRLHGRKLRALGADLKRLQVVFDEHGEIPRADVERVEKQLERMSHV